MQQWKRDRNLKFRAKFNPISQHVLKLKSLAKALHHAKTGKVHREHLQPGHIWQKRSIAIEDRERKKGKELSYRCFPFSFCKRRSTVGQARSTTHVFLFWEILLFAQNRSEVSFWKTLHEAEQKRFTHTASHISRTFWFAREGGRPYHVIRWTCVRTGSIS